MTKKYYAQKNFKTPFYVHIIVFSEANREPKKLLRLVVMFTQFYTNKQIMCAKNVICSMCT